jgi:plasmid stabilization system protein ParE
MRRVLIAPSFDREAEAIGVAIEERFGEEARRRFVADLSRVCTAIAYVPRIGKIRHGYNTNLVGLPFHQNWIFFDFDDESVHFLHIVNAKRDKRKLIF